jgi:hypothetical protein
MQYVYEWAFARPLLKLYRNGHWFWDGAVDSEVCHAVTSHSERFWAEHAEECSEIVRRREASFLATSEALVYLATVYLLVTTGLDVCRSRLRRMGEARATLPAICYVERPSSSSC